MKELFMIIAGVVGGVIGGMGMGGGTLLIPILTIFLDVPQKNRLLRNFAYVYQSLGVYILLHLHIYAYIHLRKVSIIIVTPSAISLV